MNYIICFEFTIRIYIWLLWVSRSQKFGSFLGSLWKTLVYTIYEMSHIVYRISYITIYIYIYDNQWKIYDIYIYDKYTNIRYINLYVRYCIDFISSCIFSILYADLSIFYFIFWKIAWNCINFFLNFSIIYYNYFKFFKNFLIF